MIGPEVTLAATSILIATIICGSCWALSFYLRKHHGERTVLVDVLDAAPSLLIPIGLIAAKLLCYLPPWRVVCGG